jgi:hypothetical protein
MIKPKNSFKEVKVSGLETCLDLWTQHKFRGKYVDGIKSLNLLSGDGDGYGDPDAQDARQESKIVEAVDTEIMSLQTVQWWCIWKARGISTAWRFPNVNYEKTLAIALEILEARLRKNSATWHLF